MKQLNNIINEYDIDTIVYERVYSRRKISLVAGIIIAVAIQNNIKYYSNSPGHMKKVLTSNGRCKKEEIAKTLQHHYSINIEKMTDHETDSVGHVYSYLIDNELIRSA